MEIDLLHHLPSVIDHLPRYPAEPNAAPCSIAITDPRTMPDTAVYQIRVDEALPTLPLPLLDSEMVPCDFDALYQQTFSGGRFGDPLDYGVVDTLRETLSETDQDRLEKALGRLQA